MEKGRKVCNELKAIRKSIADANGIEYAPHECTHKGECAGTCPACEAEVKYLEKQLSLRALLGKAVVVAGLSVGVTACTGCGSLFQRTGDMARVEADSIEEVVMGEVAMPIEDDSLYADSAAACNKTEEAKSE